MSKLFEVFTQAMKIVLIYLLLSTSHFPEKHEIIERGVTEWVKTLIDDCSI